MGEREILCRTTLRTQRGRHGSLRKARGALHYYKIVNGKGGGWEGGKKKGNKKGLSQKGLITRVPGEGSAGKTHTVRAPVNQVVEKRRETPKRQGKAKTAYHVGGLKRAAAVVDRHRDSGRTVGLAYREQE